MPGLAARKTGIFINYRREDSSGVAGRLCDRLSRTFSQDEMFIDVDDMKPGIDFAEQIDAEISKCAVVLAVIGPGWLDAKDEKGRRRLEQPRDHVRIELATALKRAIPVIPLLVNGTVLPSEDDLPEDLKALPKRHALELRHSRFAADSDAVIKALNDILRRPKRWLRRPKRWPQIGGLAALAVSAFLFGSVGFRAIQGSSTPGPLPTAGSNVTAPAPPERRHRVALVIGNAKYPDADEPLKTPVNDALLMSQGLTSPIASFTVVSGVNLSGHEMRQRLDQFYASVKPGSIAILFFAGYAIQSNHQNYLIPVDAQIWTEADVRRDGIDLETVLKEIHSRGATLKIALIDGSRRNPYERRFRDRSAGLLPVNAPIDTIVMYSRSLNEVQNDAGGNASNSLFVTELLKNLEIRNLNASQALTQTRFAISAKTNDEQVPWIEDVTSQGINLFPNPSPR
jgi:hypothetical protein